MVQIEGINLKDSFDWMFVAIGIFIAIIVSIFMINGISKHLNFMYETPILKGKVTGKAEDSTGFATYTTCNVLGENGIKYKVQNEYSQACQYDIGDIVRFKPYGKYTGILIQ